MPGWTNDELKKIAGAEELEISSLRGDGKLGGPRTIWVVQVGADLYVRSVRGRSSAWFRGTQLKHAGQVEAGGLKKDVAFVDETTAAINASRAKRAQAAPPPQQQQGWRPWFWQ